MYNMLAIMHKYVYIVPMYIETVPNRGGRPTILLREGTRQGKTVRKRTLANLTAWPAEQITALRQVLRGQVVVPAGTHFRIERSLPHGHVEAVVGVLRQLRMETVLASRPCRERDRVLAMIAQRVVAPCSKLATTRQWQSTSLAEELGVMDTDANALYAALDWLLARQSRIEQKLAQRHLTDGAQVLYDVSSSSYHGQTCPLVRWGYNRDGTDLPCIVYGLLTDAAGRPVAVETYAGNTADSKTVADQVEKLRERFGLARVVLVGDRGLLPHTQITALRRHPQVGWISALRGPAIRKLVEQGAVQLSLFDETNVAEIRSAAYPGERLVVCKNPVLAANRQRTREELLQATEQALARIAAQVRRRTRTPLTAAAIGLKVGAILNRFKMGKHFTLEIRDGAFAYARHRERIAQETQLDGLYIIRTSESVETLSAAAIVRTYKSLAQVEQAFRCLKNVDLRLRPIHHRTVDHVKAHVFLCMLAYYVEWHLRRALAPVLFQDDDLPAARRTRDPVAPAQPRAHVQRKKQTQQTPDGWPVHSFHTLLDELATRCKNVCRIGDSPDAPQVTQFTEPTAFQRYVFELLGLQWA